MYVDFFLNVRYKRFKTRILYEFLWEIDISIHDNFQKEKTVLKSVLSV